MSEITAHAQELADETMALAQAAVTMKIESDEQYEAAAIKVKMMSDMARAVVTERKQITRPIDEAKKRIMDFFGVPLYRLEGATKILKRQLMEYQNVKEQKRLFEQARLEDLQRKEMQKLKKQAAQAEKVGKAAKAELLQREAANMPAPVVANEPLKAAGVATKITWHAEVESLDFLIKAVADGELPSRLLLPNMPVLNSVARSMRGAMNYPGVKAVSTKGIAA